MSSRFQTHHQRGGRGVIYWKKRNNTYAVLAMLHTRHHHAIPKFNDFFGRKISMWYWIQCRAVRIEWSKGQMQSYCDHLSNCKKRRKLYGDIFSWKLWQNYNSICIYFSLLKMHAKYAAFDEALQNYFSDRLYKQK